MCMPERVQIYLKDIVFTTVCVCERERETTREWERDDRKFWYVCY